MQKALLPTLPLAYLTLTNDFLDSERVPRILYIFQKRETHSPSLKGKFLTKKQGVRFKQFKSQKKGVVKTGSLGSLGEQQIVTIQV